MKKAILAALVFIVVGFALVNGTFALPDLDEVFADLTHVLGDLGRPTPDTAGVVDVALVSDDTPQQLYPGGAASRVTRVVNQGSGAVYFRLCYAIQYDELSWKKLKIEFDASGYKQTDDWLDITIGNTPYKMKVFTYTEELASGAKSPAVKLTIAMDDSVTSEEISRYRADFLQTQVLAIDVETFANANILTAQDALDKALPLKDSFNPF